MLGEKVGRIDGSMICFNVGRCVGHSVAAVLGNEVTV